MVNNGERLLLNVVESDKQFTGIIYSIEESKSHVICYRLFFKNSELKGISVSGNSYNYVIDFNDRDLLVKLLLTPIDSLTIIPGIDTDAFVGGDGIQPIDKAEWRAALSTARMLLKHIRKGSLHAP